MKKKLKKKTLKKKTLKKKRVSRIKRAKRADNVVLGVSRTRKKRSKAGVEKLLRLFEVTLQGRQIERYIGHLCADDLDQLSNSGISIGNEGLSLSTLEFSIGGIREVGFDLDLLTAYVDEVELPIIFPRSKKPKTLKSYRRQTVIYGDNYVKHCVWTAQVEARSISDICVECHLSERWVLPNGQQADIYTVSVTGEDEADVEFQDGGSGSGNISVYLPDGKVAYLSEDTDDSGRNVIRLA